MVRLSMKLRRKRLTARPNGYAHSKPSIAARMLITTCTEFRYPEARLKSVESGSKLVFVHHMMMGMLLIAVERTESINGVHRCRAVAVFRCSRKPGSAIEELLDISGSS